jgi:pimeloyl-ACP methyl ester carboxylesterase
VRRLAVCAALLLACCANPRELHLREAETIANAGQLTPRVLYAGGVNLLSFERPGPAHGLLTVYIEGDGRAWINPWQPSIDPTPTDPVGLRLAAADPARPLVYLARPCQFEMTEACDKPLWTTARLSPEIVAIYQQLLDEALRQTGSSGIGLIGYSGGGALAALIAERRHDVAWLVTVAADLDLAEWVRLQDLAPLSGSLDPAADTGAIRSLPQVHFVGGADRVVPPQVVQSFVRRFRPDSPVRTVVEPGFDHGCCWSAAWPELLKQLEPPITINR